MAKHGKWTFCAIWLCAGWCQAQELRLSWGLENTWSYKEATRSDDESAAVRGTDETKHAKRDRAFAFTSKREVVEPMLKCFERHHRMWDSYSAGRAEEEMSRKEFEQLKSDQDPVCQQHAKKQAPSLYFDFVGSSGKQYVLERVVITTVDFEEYKGGGFVQKEAWYDILLSHARGTKSYAVNPRLVFSGFGRTTLRFWSDNFYPQMGWMSPMGEYTLKIEFVFSTDNDEQRISTPIFKIDV